MQLVLLASAVLRLFHTDPQHIPELATVARSTADIRDVSVNAEERSITLNGSPQQNAIAEWLAPKLDVRGTRPIASPYKAGADDVVQVFYLKHAASPQQMMEVVTTARSLAEVPRAFVYRPAGAMVARGTAEQIALLEWLVPQLDLPGPGSGSPEHRIGGRIDDVARVFYAGESKAPQELQEITTVIRSIGDIRRAFTYGASKAIAMRAPAEQIALAEFLFEKLNRPAGSFAPGSQEFLLAGDPEGVVRLFAVPAGSDAEFQQRARDIRVATGLRRAFTYGIHRALVVRGTPEQVARARQLVNEFSQK